MEKRSSLFQQLYLFSNENLVECLKNFSLEGKECLTVLGSSDQAFDLYLNGAKSVDAFDINSKTKHYYELKKALLTSGLSRKELLDILLDDTNNQIFQSETFQKIFPYLEPDSQLFWQNLVDNYSAQEIYKNLFSLDKVSKTTLEQTVGYLSTDENYQKLQRKTLPQLEFYHCNFKDLKKTLTKNYDFMYLSNIAQYIPTFYEQEENPDKSKLHSKIQQLSQFKKDIENLSSYLKDQGTLVVGYFYQMDYPYYQKRRNNNLIFQREIRESIFPRNHFFYHYFTAVNELEDKAKYGFTDNVTPDACMVYQKRP